MSGFGGFGTNPTSGGLFGAKPPESTFGTPAAGTTGLTFGTPTFGSPGTGLFGTTSASSTFGAAAPTLPSSGTATTTTSAFTFGMPATSTSAPTFGTPSTSAPAFGTTLNFNLPKTTSSASTTNTLSTTTSMSFNFGSQQPTTTSSFGFGVPQTAAPASQSGGFTFNPPTTTSTALSFGATKTTATLSLGTTSTFSAPSTTPAFNFTFTTPSTTTTTTSTVTTGLSLGAGFGAKPGDTSGQGKVVGSPGLGGVDKTQLNQGLSGGGVIEPKQIKDNVLPDQILQTLNDFQNFTKQQKSISVEISHGSSKPLKKVQEDTEIMESLLTMISSGLTRNALAVDKLKTETAQGLHQAEMAQRNHETPPGLDYDSTAPAEYFNDLVTKFETDTMRLKVQIEASEKHLRSLTQSSSISPQELTLAMRRLHETLVVLAARVQTLHTTVQSQKEQYRNLRRVYLKDDTAVFDKEDDQQQNRKQTIFSLHSLTGPTPFSETSASGRPLNVDGLAMLTGATTAPVISTASNPGWITPLPTNTRTGSLLTSPNALQTPLPGETAGFQLSKPPTGNKRNKR